MHVNEFCDEMFTLATCDGAKFLKHKVGKRGQRIFRQDSVGPSTPLGCQGDELDRIFPHSYHKLITL